MAIGGLLRRIGRGVICATLVASAWGMGMPATPAAVPGGPSFSGGFDQKMDLQADVITFVQKGGAFSSMVASGNVEMKTGDGMTLLCDYLNYNPEEEKMHAKAQGSKRVIIRDAQRTGECGQLIYDTKTSKSILSDNAKIVQGEFVVTGDVLTFSPVEGGMQMTDESSASVQKGRASPSLAKEAEENVKKMMETFPLQDGEARRILDGKGQPARVTIDTKKRASGPTSQSVGPQSGRISPETLDRIPDKSQPKGPTPTGKALELEE